MNKTHRLIWSDVRQTWVVTHEAATAKGKPASQPKRLAVMVAGVLLSTLAVADEPAPTALPTGGQVVSGSATISQSGSQMTINQATNKAIVNWNTFNIGSSAGVTFNQPSSSAVVLNRVLSSDPSAIYGSLNANGQVFIINPNGVIFGKGASVNVQGIVASTLNIGDADFMNGNYRFSRDGAMGSVLNQGEIIAKYVALLAPEVRNEGIIAANMGTVALVAGEAVTLDITGHNLVDVQVEKASINTLVSNHHLIQADEGVVIMSAQSANGLIGSVVNTGQIEANGITSDGGVIRIRASSNIANTGTISADAATNGNGGNITAIADLSNPDSLTTVDGIWSARGGSASGNGGFIETSGTHLKIASTAHIDTSATNGKTGQWLLDPYDFTIAASGGDITGTALSTALGLNNVTIQTTDTAATCTNATCGAGTSSGNGDIFVNDTVSWASASTLTLDAWRNIEVNQAISVTGSGGLTLKYGQQAANTGNDAAYLLSKPINLASGATFRTQLGNDGTLMNYTIINDRSDLNNVDSISGNNYVLGANIAGGPTPFTPISGFASVFDGLGHTIGLNIDTADVSGNSGLFADITSSGEVRNLGLTNVSVTGTASSMGGIAGVNNGRIHHSYVTGSVVGTGTDQMLGGLVGTNNGSIASSYSSATVTGADGDLNAVVGGLVGVNFGGSITNSYATGTVSKASGATTGAIGGLVGSNESGGSISNSYASGSVSAGTSTRQGGFVGMNGNNDSGTGSTITNSYYNSDTSGQGTGIGNDVTGSQTVTAKTTAQLTAASVLADLGLSEVTWMTDSTTGYPVLRGIVYSASGVPTVVYVRLTAGSSIYGNTPTLNFSYYDSASGGNVVSITPDGTVSWLHNSNPITLSSTTAAATYSLTYGSGLSLTNYSFSAGAAADWTITQRSIQLTADNRSKTYGDTLTLGNTAFALTSGSYANSETVTSATLGSATGKAGDTSAAAGSYNSEITISNATGGGGFNASNYTINYANGSLTINPAVVAETTSQVDSLQQQVTTTQTQQNLVTAATIGLTTILSQGTSNIPGLSSGNILGLSTDPLVSTTTGTSVQEVTKTITAVTGVVGDYLKIDPNLADSYVKNRVDPGPNGLSTSPTGSAGRFGGGFGGALGSGFGGGLSTSPTANSQQNGNKKNNSSNTSLRDVSPTAWTKLELTGADKDLASKIAAKISANPANAAALVKALVTENPDHAEAIKASAKVTLPGLEIEPKVSESNEAYSNSGPGSGPTPGPEESILVGRENASNDSAFAQSRLDGDIKKNKSPVQEGEMNSFARKREAQEQEMKAKEQEMNAQEQEMEAQMKAQQEKMKAQQEKMNAQYQWLN